jgi:hypothetical protein
MLAGMLARSPPGKGETNLRPRSLFSSLGKPVFRPVATGCKGVNNSKKPTTSYKIPGFWKHHYPFEVRRLSVSAAEFGLVGKYTYWISDGLFYTPADASTTMKSISYKPPFVDAAGQLTESFVCLWFNFKAWFNLYIFRYGDMQFSISMAKGLF